MNVNYWNTSSKESLKLVMKFLLNKLANKVSFLEFIISTSSKGKCSTTNIACINTVGEIGTLTGDSLGKLDIACNLSNNWRLHN